MESRKLGNKTKIIKLMSKVGNYGLIIIKPIVMKILTFATRSKMKSYRGWQAH